MSPRNRHNNWYGLPEGVGAFVLALPYLKTVASYLQRVAWEKHRRCIGGLRIAGYLSGRYRQRASSLPPILIIIDSFLQVHLIVVLNGH
jgi:hypothetical protein